MSKNIIPDVKIVNVDGFIGLVVFQYRVKAGKNGRQCADILGLSQSQFSRLENGRSEWTINQLLTIGKYLEMPADKVIKRAELLV